MKEYKIQVNTPDLGWVFGCDSNGREYAYISRELAENAAQLWGDAYLKGEVRVVEVHYGRESS